MKHIFIIVLVLVAAAVCVTSAQTVDRSPSQSPEIFHATPLTDAQFDLQFDYDAQTVTGAAGNAGAVFIGTEFWTSRWATNVLHRWNPNGTLIEQFTVAGVTGVRGMAYDGQYIYASSNSATIFKIDPVAKTLVGTITCGGGVTTRMITYDPVRDGFWTSNFTGNISCVNRSGAVIATITSTLAAKYGSAYDPWTAGGPFLWVWDQTNTVGGTPQNLYQINLTTLTFTGFSFDVLTRVTTGGTAALAGGLFITTGFVPGKATIGGLLQGVPDRLFGLELATTSADTVLPFTLLTPAAGTKITTIPGSATPVVMSWDTNRVGVTYKWIFGNPTVPPRRFTLPSTGNVLNTTLGALDAMLAGGGVAQGDSLIGQWDVWAFRNNAPTNDSLKSTNGPRAMILKRSRPALAAFSLVSPPSGTTIVTSSVVTTPISLVWTKSGAGAMYRWKFATPAFPGTIRLNVATALDTAATFRSSQLDSLIAGLGVAQGDSIVGQWRAYAYSGTDSLASTQTFNVTFKRAVPPTTYVLQANPGPTNNGGSPSWGMFLDLIAGPHDLTVTDMTTASTATAGAGFTIEFFVRSGTSLGGPVGSGPGSSTAGWTSLGTVPVTQGGTAGGVSLLFATPPISVSAGDTAGVAMRFNSVGPRYYGTGSPAYSTYSDANLTLITGDARSTPFTTTGSWFASRALVGEVHYTVVTVDVGEPGQGVPSTFALSQNYPNPFNPSTTIRYQIPGQTHVALGVFDVLGREVARLVNEVKQAGMYTARWDAHGVASGVYFYRLEAGTFTSVKKLLLLK